MAERLLTNGEKGQHQCDTCLKLFDFVGNGKWIPTTCPDCKKSAVNYTECLMCGGIARNDDFCLKCWGELHGINP